MNCDPLFFIQKRRAEHRIDIPVVVGNFLAFADITPRNAVATLPNGVGILGMIDVAVVIDG
jgi:hypothetical protein